MSKIDDPKLENARQELEKILGVYVGSAFGYPYLNDMNGIPEQFLIIWSNKPINAPASFYDYRVVIRKIPKAL